MKHSQCYILKGAGRRWYHLLIGCLIAIKSYGQQHDYYYHALDSIKMMLEEKQPADFKKAVFWVENAWHDDSLIYKDFEQDIKQIAKKCKIMVQQKGFSKYKTAGNWAVFAWMTQKIPENDSTPCLYDFDDFLGRKNYANTFVTRVLKDKKGNCCSLPLLYKCIAQELNVEARLALGPNHVWIRHIDEKGKWTNIELTSGQFPSDGLLMTELGITTEAVKSGAYSTPLEEKQAVAFLLNLLAQGFETKYGVSDSFPDRCYNLSIQYFQANALAYMGKSNLITARSKRQIAAGSEGNLEKQYNEHKSLKMKLTELGVSEIAPETYNKWVADMQTRKN